MSKGGLKTFSDIFEETIDAEQTPRESLIDSVEKLRKERLKDFSDALQFQNWKALSDFDYKGWMDDNIKEGKRLATVKKVSTYQRFVASAVHMASKNPIFSVAYSIRTQQEALQSQYLTAFTESMEKWVREPNQEVRVKAVEILDYLRNTDQKLTYDSDGAIVFTRDGHRPDGPIRALAKSRPTHNPLHRSIHRAHRWRSSAVFRHRETPPSFAMHPDAPWRAQGQRLVPQRR